MSLDQTLTEAIAPLIDRGLISDVLQLLKSGKEATVYCCRGGPRLPNQLLAVKVYRPAEHRHFRNDGAYRQGRVIPSGRIRRAVDNGSAFGKQAAFGLWVGTEWGHLNVLRDAGLDVPRPIDTADHVIAMDYLGDGPDRPAPQLRSVRLTPKQATDVWDRLVWNVGRMLALDRVHGDLSPYNLLWHDGLAWIIDVPQMVDPRENPNARSMLDRDLENVWRYCSKFAPLSDPWRVANHLWDQWRLGRL